MGSILQLSIRKIIIGSMAMVALLTSVICVAEGSEIVLLIIKGSLAIGMAMIIGMIVANILCRPIRELTIAAHKITEGDYDIKVSAVSKNEIGSLISKFNKMVEIMAQQMQYVDLLPTPVMLIDNEYNIKYMNKTGAAILNKTQKELIGQKCYSNFKTSDCQTEKCSCAQAIKYGKTKAEETVARPQGEPGLPIMYTGTPIRDKNGNIIGALEYVVDISEIKNMQKYLNRKTSEILSAIEKFAEGDLSILLDIEKDDDMGRLFKGFNNAVGKIRNLLTEVIAAIDATASASNQISGSTEEIAAGAQEQSSQTTEVASAIEEMTKTIIETTTHSSNAAESAKKAGSIAHEGGLVVEETITRIIRVAEAVKISSQKVATLGKNSEQIGEIVQVINDIADQTNLLALNAAIEAARAGEQGRGFAVVADEVRKLAERTTKATKEIAEMIKQIQKDTFAAVETMNEGTEAVEKGRDSAYRAGQSLKQIIKGAEETLKVVDQVAIASEEQSTAAEQISRNIDGINNITKETTLGIQQIAKASEELNNLTANLQTIASQFITDRQLEKHVRYLN